MMSGTSLDGVDLACCRFSGIHPEWDFEILEAQTIRYPQGWKNKLAEAPGLDGEQLALLNAEYGNYLGGLLDAFHRAIEITPDFAVSHGHTIFHRPAKGMTLQIGHGACLAARSGVPVISDLRSMDVALGGQGAPLVPAGDHLLFPEYDFCLNLGGFANISFLSEGNRVAFDICPVNIVLNPLSQRCGKEFDENGHLAASGNPDPELLSALNRLPYYHQDPPKSLGREWVEANILPLTDPSPLRPEDLLATFTEHMAGQVSKIFQRYNTGSTTKQALVTGGGAKNSYLADRIRSMTSTDLVIPPDLLIDFKEALVFAFLGLLRWLELPNVYASVTGAPLDSCGGSVYLP